MLLARRSANVLVLLALAYTAVWPQAKGPFNPPVEPFSIKNGSSFSASGGLPAEGSISLEDRTRISRITSEIREAEELIRRNQVNGSAITSSEMTKAALEGALRSLDPHSNFFDPAEWADMLDEQRSGYTGMGATIANYVSGGVTDTYILSVFPGSPAAKAQLGFGDKIISVNGEATTGQTSDAVRDKIRGTSGTMFRIKLQRSATGRIETLEIRRGHVSQPSIPDTYMVRPGIGYVDMSEGFNYTTSAELDTALQSLKHAGMRSLILDLRGNGGGIVDQAVKVAEKFLPAGTLILTQKGRARIDNRTWRSSNSAPEKMPLVILVDENTASASEIVAGAFQDNDRALIVGERTFGKGLVQSVIDLPGNTGLTLTAARYLTPSGRSIQRDYSKLDLYDYFNHKTAAAVDKPYFEARTVTDRRVFGGDGIQPDDPVKSDEITEAETSLLDQIFGFSREAAAGRIAGQESYHSTAITFNKRISAGDDLISDGLMSAFYAYAIKNSDGKLTADLLRSEASFIKLRLRYNLVMASFGSVAANQVLVENDQQVAKAVEVLPQAAQLAQLAAKARQSASW